MVLLGAGGAALAIIAQAIHLGVKRILVFVREERLVHYRSIVQLIEEGFDFLIELYAIEKDEDVQSSFNQADLIFKCDWCWDGWSVSSDSESLDLPPQALIVEMAYYPAVTPFLQLAVNQGNQRG